MAREDAAAERRRARDAERAAKLQEKEAKRIAREQKIAEAKKRDAEERLQVRQISFFFGCLFGWLSRSLWTHSLCVSLQRTADNRQQVGLAPLQPSLKLAAKSQSSSRPKNKLTDLAIVIDCRR